MPHKLIAILENITALRIALVVTSLFFVPSVLFGFSCLWALIISLILGLYLRVNLVTFLRISDVVSQPDLESSQAEKTVLFLFLQIALFTCVPQIVAIIFIDLSNHFGDFSFTFDTTIFAFLDRYAYGDIDLDTMTLGARYVLSAMVLSVLSFFSYVVFGGRLAFKTSMKIFFEDTPVNPADDVRNLRGIYKYKMHLASFAFFLMPIGLYILSAHALNHGFFSQGFISTFILLSGFSSFSVLFLVCFFFAFGRRGYRGKKQV